MSTTVFTVIFYVRTFNIYWLLNRYLTIVAQAVGRRPSSIVNRKQNKNMLSSQKNNNQKMSFDLKTQLPLLPSARKNKIQQISSSTSNTTDDDTNTNDGNDTIRTASSKLASSSPISTNAECSSSTPTTTATSNNHTAALKIRTDQLNKLSSHPPIPTSITTTMIIQYLSTTVNFINSFAATAEDKLETCGMRIRDLDVKLLLLESKLNSVEEGVEGVREEIDVLDGTDWSLTPDGLATLGWTVERFWILGEKTKRERDGKRWMQPYLHFCVEVVVLFGKTHRIRFV